MKTNVLRQLHTNIIILISASVFFVANAKTYTTVIPDTLKIMCFETPDSLTAKPIIIPCESSVNGINSTTVNQYKFKPLQLVVPVTLIGIGAIGTMSDWFEGQNHEIRDELQEHNPKRFTFDDFTQYTPIFTAYALDLGGVKGLHNPIDQTIILGTSALLMSGTVYTVKNLTKVQRPDGSTFNSFPSGHTATAFRAPSFYVGNTGIRRHGLVWQDMLSQPASVSSACIITGTGSPTC